MRNMTICCIALVLLTAACTAVAATPSMADFDRRARAGETLNVVFFGASLTWGANATNQPRTSYRAVMEEFLEKQYPRARFECYDAAIGGTNSQLGVFRLNRDVLGLEPDIVFLDFSANDNVKTANTETLASYEALVRRIVGEGKCPVVMAIFPFGWNVTKDELGEMAGRKAHLKIANHYGVPVGDAIVYCKGLYAKDKGVIERIWDLDPVHPGDFGYRKFAEAVWAGFVEGVEQEMVCRVPKEMLHAATYMESVRVRISTLGKLPEGWQVGRPHRVAAWFDGMMCRWLDDLVIASNRGPAKDPKNRREQTPRRPEPLEVKFRGSMVMLFGEETLKSGQYRAFVDGKACTRMIWAKGKKQQTDIFTASAVPYGGNRQHAQVLVTGLEPKADHTLRILPLFGPDDEPRELRIESICVAGKGARVWR